MKRVIIESPYAGDIENNKRYAQMCLKHSLEHGEAPIASHLLYTQVLFDFVAEERRLGIEAGLAWLPVAELHVFYTDMGWSPGMLEAKNRCIELGVAFEERSIFPSDKRIGRKEWLEMQDNAKRDGKI